MMPVEDLTILKDFQLDAAEAVLWAFKKHLVNGVPKYTGRWVPISDELKAAIKTAVANARDGITETIEYDLLAQNNESSALTIPLLETHADQVLAQTADQLPQKMVKNLKQLTGTNFYSVQLVHENTVIHCVRKTDDSWKSKNAKGMITAIFTDAGLALESNPSFSISKYFDFFIVNETVLISQKASFEQCLNYKEAHIKDFSTLQGERDFLDIFSDIGHLVTYVGSNKMQLRRASAIKAKGHYKDAGFMQSLRDNCQAFGLNITFDQNGKIVPSEQSCKDIFQALLDHRLKSHYQKIYDVPSAVSIN